MTCSPDGRVFVSSSVHVPQDVLTTLDVLDRLAPTHDLATALRRASALCVIWTLDGHAPKVHVAKVSGEAPCEGSQFVLLVGDIMIDQFASRYDTPDIAFPKVAIQRVPRGFLLGRRAAQIKLPSGATLSYRIIPGLSHLVSGIDEETRCLVSAFYAERIRVLEILLRDAERETSDLQAREGLS